MEACSPNTYKPTHSKSWPIVNMAVSCSSFGPITQDLIFRFFGKEIENSLRKVSISNFFYFFKFMNHVRFILVFELNIANKSS